MKNLRHLRRLFILQKGMCYICEERMSTCRAGVPLLSGSNFSHPMGWTRDHVLPRRAVTKGAKRLTLLAHEKCNSKKGCRMPTKRELNKCKEIHRKIEGLN